MAPLLSGMEWRYRLENRKMEIIGLILENFTMKYNIFFEKMLNFYIQNNATKAHGIHTLL